MLQLSQINIFPVKSLDGFSPASAIVERRGLQHDRRWLITDPNGQFMTQRTNGRMALLRATIEGNDLVIREKQNPSNAIAIPIHLENSELSTVSIWDDTLMAAPTTQEADTWLSDFLQVPCRLVAMPDTTERRVDEKYNRGEDIVSFADGYPFLIIGEASMHDLNEQLKQHTQDPFTPYSIRRFRSTFVFSGGTPYQEDSFTYFKIGEVDFVGVKPCARCVLTTRDPDTGIKGKEPFATLSTYRQVGNKVLFGQNLVWHHQQWPHPQQPVVRVGDVISF